MHATINKRTRIVTNPFDILADAKVEIISVTPVNYEQIINESIVGGSPARSSYATVVISVAGKGEIPIPVSRVERFNTEKYIISKMAVIKTLEVYRSEIPQIRRLIEQYELFNQDFVVEDCADDYRDDDTHDKRYRVQYNYLRGIINTRKTHHLFVQLFRESQREWATSLLATSAARDILYKFAMHGPFGHHSNVDELLHCWRYDRDLFIRVAVKSEAMYALTEKGMLAFAYMDGFETFNAASAYWRLHEYFSKKEKEAVEAYKLKNG